MDKSFQGLLIKKNPRSIGRIKKVSLSNLKFQVKIYNNKITNIGPIMIK